jgi:hypothetical protein
MLKNQSNKLFNFGIIFIVTIVIAMALMAIINRGYFKSRSFIGGDEPHYVMMVDSLLKDKDFNLKNDYELSRSIQYYGEELFPHLAPIIDYKNSNNWQSIHTIGLPLLMYAPYKIAGVLGVRIFLIILQLSTIIVFYFILKKYIKDKTKVLIGLLLLTSCSLFWQNLGGIFPDILLVLFVGLSILLFGKKDLLSNFEISILIVVAVLTHSKSIAVLVPIYIFHYLYLIKQIGFTELVKKYWSPLLVTIIAFLFYANYLYVNYGVILPSQLYGEKGQLFRGNMIFNLLAILFDRVKGLLIYFPVLAVSGPYLTRAFLNLKNNLKTLVKNKNTERLFVLAGVMIGMTLLLITQLGFDDWSGSFSPNGRYMLVFIFAIIFLIARYINYKNIYELVVLSVFTLANFIITIFTISKVNIYFDAGKDSVLSNKLLINKILPIFQLVITKSEIGYISYSIILISIIVLLNVALFNLYKKNEAYE